MTTVRGTLKKRISPAQRLVLSLEGEYVRLSDAAEILDVSPKTLRRLFKTDDEKLLELNLGPSAYVPMGKRGRLVYLYTPDDITRLRTYFEDLKKVRPIESLPHAGRPAKWTAEQRKTRQRLYSSRHYYNRRAEELLAEGRHDEAKAA